MRKRFFVLLLSFILIFCSMTVSAKSLLGNLSDAKEDIEEGSLSEEDMDITDVMGNWSNTNTPDEQMMQEGTEVINSTLGYVLSFLIMIFFALLALTTALDLLWIGCPAIRPVLYDSNAGSTNANLHSSVMHGIAQNEMARAQNAYMQGDFARANRLQNQSLRSEAEGQYRDANWFGNKDKLSKAQQNSQGSLKARCFISPELRELVNQGQVNITVTSNSNNMVIANSTSKRNILLQYMKKRSIVLVLFAGCTILLTSSVFTDFGINVGEFILHWLGF